MPSKGSIATDIANRTRRSQRFFNRWSLFAYDFSLFNFISPYLWGCNKSLLLLRYQRWCGSSHLEVGVGTGYLLDRSNPEIKTLHLLDLSEACLSTAAKRLQRYQPQIWLRNILQPIEGVEPKFDSISINYVMHCVPGSFAEKGIAFKHLKPLLKERGILFGASVMKGPNSNILANTFMCLLNGIGLFNSARDKVDQLELELKRHFRFVKITCLPASILFCATDNPHTLNDNRQKGTVYA